VLLPGAVTAVIFLPDPEREVRRQNAETMIDGPRLAAFVRRRTVDLRCMAARSPTERANVLADHGPRHSVDVDARPVEPAGEVRQSARIRTDGVGRAGALLEVAQEIVNRGRRRLVRTDDAWTVRIGRDVDVEDRHGLILRGAARANGLATP